MFSQTGPFLDLQDYLETSRGRMQPMYCNDWKKCMHSVYSLVFLLYTKKQSHMHVVMLFGLNIVPSDLKCVFNGSSEASWGISCTDRLLMVPHCHSVLPPPQNPQSCLPLQHWESGAPPEQRRVSLAGHRQATDQISHVGVNAAPEDDMCSMRKLLTVCR